MYSKIHLLSAILLCVFFTPIYAQQNAQDYYRKACQHLKGNEYTLALEAIDQIIEGKLLQTHQLPDRVDMPKITAQNWTINQGQHLIVTQYNGLNVQLMDIDLEVDFLADDDAAAATGPDQLASKQYLAWAQVFQKRGEILLKMKRFEEALESFERVCALAPDKAVAHFYRARALSTKAERLDQALEAVNEAIRLDDKQAIFYNFRGVQHRSKGNHQGAYDDYKKALVLNPTFAMAAKNLAQLYQLDKKEAEALKVLEQQVALGVENKDVYIMLAWLYTDAGNTEKTLIYAAKAADMGVGEGWLLQGRVYSRKDSYREAIAYFREAVLLDPKLTTAYVELAVAEYMTGDQEQACVSIQKALDVLLQNGEEQTSSSFQTVEKIKLQVGCK